MGDAPEFSGPGSRGDSVDDANQWLGTPEVYEEVRRMASAQMRHQRLSHTLSTTALVHEAYLRL